MFNSPPGTESIPMALHGKGGVMAAALRPQSVIIVKNGSGKKAFMSSGDEVRNGPALILSPVDCLTKDVCPSRWNLRKHGNHYGTTLLHLWNTGRLVNYPSKHFCECTDCTSKISLSVTM